MSAPCVSACSPWTDEALGCSDLDPAITDQAIAAASDILFTLSGRQFPGTCRAIILVCGTECRRCCYKGASVISLPEFPVVEINEVRIDGVAVDATKYRVDDYRLLVRIDGEGWPHRGFNATSPEAVEIDFAYGVSPPPAGVFAASKLAGELAKSCVGAECALPARVTSISRQGLDAVALDPFEFFADGRVGIFEVDAFLTAFNPKRIQRASTVYSSDLLPKHTRITTST